LYFPWVLRGVYCTGSNTALRGEPEINAPLMTNGLENQATRRLACANCGTEFGCSLSGPCWCSDEAFRLPMPLNGSDCLCPDCLRKAAVRLKAST
jgi:hypothetical protein